MRKLLVLVAFSAVVALNAPAMAAWMLLDNFEGHDLGPIHGQGNWSTPNPGGTVLANPDPQPWSSQAMWQSADGDPIAYYYDGAPIVAQGETATLFMRVRYDMTGGDWQVGLSHQTSPGTSWNDFKVQTTVIHDPEHTWWQFSPRESAGEFNYIHESVEWVNLWLVINNSDGGSYQVYMTTGTADAAEADRLARGGQDTWGYRGGAYSGDLNSILLRRGSGSVDDIYVAQGVVLSNPIPEPATMGLLAMGALGLLARRRR